MWRDSETYITMGTGNELNKHRNIFFAQNELHRGINCKGFKTLERHYTFLYNLGLNLRSATLFESAVL